MLERRKFIKYSIGTSLSALVIPSLGKEESSLTFPKIPRFPILLNMVHDNPGEPKFNTRFRKPGYLKKLGYTGQVPVIQIQCGLTYDHWENNVIPEKSEEKLWIERHAAGVRRLIDNAKEIGMPLYPFTDILVLPQSIMDKYGEELKIEGRISILRQKTKELVKAQINEIFWRFPDIEGLTTRFGETYLQDTPFHRGESPVKTAEEQSALLNILREEICVKRNKKLFYRTWDFGSFHNQPDFYMEVTNRVEPHPLLFMSIKNVSGDFLRGIPFNPTIGIGKHQQIVEVSINQAGCYGKNSHPYYMGKGIIEGWPEMKQKKGLQDISADAKIKGVWLWTWGDGWAGPYFDNELWVHLNEHVLRNYVLNTGANEKEIFNNYVRDQLKMEDADCQKLRTLCMQSVNAVYFGQASQYFFVKPWWCRDQYLTAIHLEEVVSKKIVEKVKEEKKENSRLWEKMEKLAYQIKIPDPDAQAFLGISTTYGRIKFQVIEQIWKIQIMLAIHGARGQINKTDADTAVRNYEAKWKEWTELRKEYPACPTLYQDEVAVHCGPPFQTSLNKLKQLISSS